MTEVQPMKMAAAEGLYETRSGAPFSILTIGSLDGTAARPILEVPGLLSFLGTGSFSGEIKASTISRRLTRPSSPTTRRPLRRPTSR